MKDLRKFMKLALLLAVSFSISTTTNSQCTAWTDLEDGSVEKEDAENNYQIYRGHVKEKNFEAALVAWEKLLSVAPAADGKRLSVWWDGIKIMKGLNKKESDDAKKAEREDRIVQLHKQCIECMEAGKITLKSAKTEDAFNAKIADQYARLAEDMHKSKAKKAAPADIYAAAKKAVELGGKAISWRALHPYAKSVVAMYKSQAVPAEEARRVHDELNAIAEDNIINYEEEITKWEEAGKAKKKKKAEQSSKLYTRSKIRMNKEFKKVEKEIFDCAYFKDKYMSDFEEGREDRSVIKTIYSKLKKRGCPEEDEFVAQLSELYKELGKQINAERQAEFNANNPAVVAKKFYDGGEFTKAIEKWEEAIAGETDPAKQAGYYFKIASTQGRKLNQYSKARTNARTAAKLRANWGMPFMLLGDLYAKSSSRCGDDWNQRLAVLAAIEKWSYAKSIDPAVAGTAGSRISKYLGARPAGAEGHMRGVEEGSKAKCGCWIGETVTVKFK